jgi:hypothetical protein
MATTLTDYCTLFPDRAFGRDWSACCMVHDLAYGADGSRMAADLELASCVTQATGWHGLGALMFAGVAAFGWWFRRKGKKERSA